MGLIFAVGMIIAAIAMGQSNANFFNGPSFMIVILGTMAAAAISYTGEELKRAGSIIAIYISSCSEPSNMADVLLGLAVVPKDNGAIKLRNELKKDDFLQRAVQPVDGYRLRYGAHAHMRRNSKSVISVPPA